MHQNHEGLQLTLCGNGSFTHLWHMSMSLIPVQRFAPQDLKASSAEITACTMYHKKGQDLI